MEDWAVEWFMARQSSEADLVLIEIYHPMMETFRLVRNRVAITRLGQVYNPSWFSLDILNDDNEIVKSQLTLPNVSRLIGNTLRTIIGPAEVNILVVNSANIDAEPPPYRAGRLKLRNVNRDPNFLTGDLSRGDENTEVCGTIKMTPARAPALFRL